MFTLKTLDQHENTESINPDIQIVDLESPVMMGTLEINSIEIRKPNVTALQGVKIADLLNGDVTAICNVIPRVSTPTLTKSQINQLEPSDLAQIGGVLVLFLQPKSVRVEHLRQQ